MAQVRSEIRSALGIITLDRPEKRNAFTLDMFRLLTAQLTELDGDPAVRAIVICAAGRDFTTGLDLMDTAPSLQQGQRPFAETAIDPWHVIGRHRHKPLVVAVQGRCHTLGLELVLAADGCIAARDSTFALREVQAGFLPLGGGVVRLLETVGWSEAMRWALTGDEFSAEDALRLHVVQELVSPGEQLPRALELAGRMAAQPPLATRAVLDHAREALELGRRAALAHVPAIARPLLNTEDAREATLARLERRPGVFHGR